MANAPSDEHPLWNLLKCKDATSAAWKYGGAAACLDAFVGFGTPAVEIKAEKDSFCAGGSLSLLRAEVDFHWGVGPDRKRERRAAPLARLRCGLAQLTWKNPKWHKRDLLSVPAQTHSIAAAGFWLATLFRGHQGWSWLSRVLAEMQVAEGPVEAVAAWPEVKLPNVQAELGRPALVAVTRSALVGIQVQPYKESEEGLDSHRLKATRKCIEALADALGLDAVPVLIGPNAAGGHARWKCLTWSDFTNALLDTADDKSWQAESVRLFRRESPEGGAPAPDEPTRKRRSHSSAKGLFGLKNGGKSDPDDWQATRFVLFRSPFAPYLGNTLTTGGGGIDLLCECCGGSWSFGSLAKRGEHPLALSEPSKETGWRVPAKPKSKKADKSTASHRKKENARLLDLLADVAADKEFLGRVLKRLEICEDAVEWHSFWPRMAHKPATEDAPPSKVEPTPDFFVATTDAFISFEAKRPEDKSRVTAQVARELLVRTAHVREVQRRANDGRKAIVVYLAKEKPNDWEKAVSAQFKNGNGIWHWSLSEKKKKEETKPLWDESDYKRLGITGAKDLCGSIIVLTWQEVIKAIVDEGTVTASVRNGKLHSLQRASAVLRASTPRRSDSPKPLIPRNRLPRRHHHAPHRRPRQRDVHAHVVAIRAAPSSVTMIQGRSRPLKRRKVSAMTLSAARGSSARRTGMAPMFSLSHSAVRPRPASESTAMSAGRTPSSRALWMASRDGDFERASSATRTTRSSGIGPGSMRSAPSRYWSAKRASGSGQR